MAELRDLLSHCIRCGFCLESCPTFVLTGEETESPRGRIYLTRAALDGDLAWKDIAPHLDLCLGCRACETACPSGVEYGAILEQARGHIPISLKQKALLATVSNAGLLKASSRAAGFFGIRSGPGGARVPRAQKMPHWPVLDAPPPTMGRIILLGGCAMQVLFPRVQEASRRLLARAGWEVIASPHGCCGALHAHSGQRTEAESLLQSLLAKMPLDVPIVTDSAGCGSHLKESLTGGRQVMDLSEALIGGKLVENLHKSMGFEAALTYHDACHLAHGQKLRAGPRELLEAIPGVQLLELPESDMCCGSAGIYNVVQPKMASLLLDRKTTNIATTGASIVVTGNPGCHTWIAQGLEQVPLRVLHTAEALEASFIGLGEMSLP